MAQDPPGRSGSGSSIDDEVTDLVTAESLSPVRPGSGQLAVDAGGRYRPLAPLGEGGMGEVIEQADARTGRRLALKRIRPGRGAGPSDTARFIREARLQAQLEHPAIVPVYDIDEDAEGQPFFTMKRVRGATLRGILAGLRDGTPSICERYSRRKLLTAFSAVCQAVEYAHSRGVIHRDLKPANIMMGTFGEVYVLDWGVAKVIGDSEPDGAPLSGAVEETSAGTFMGTPGYAAPEQLEQANVDARADVYALGVVLFELLTLTRLHPGRSRDERIASTLLGADARASVRAPDRDVPPELEAICVKATQSDPQERHSSVRALLAELERFLDGDRNLALRRELSRQHGERAQDHLRSGVAATDPIGARRAALGELGRALALDPDNRDASSTFLSLVSEPPAQMPAEVTGLLARDRRAEIAGSGRLALVAYASMVLYLPLLLWSGVRSWPPLILMYAMFAVAAVAATLGARRPSVGAVLATLVSATAATATISAFCGPLILVPTILLPQIAAFVLVLPARLRPVAVLCGALGIVVPLLLELAGLVPASYGFAGGHFEVLPRALFLPETPTLVLLCVTAVAAIVTAGASIGKVRDALSTAERRIHLHAWHLRALFPEVRHADGAAASPSGSGRV